MIESVLNEETEIKLDGNTLHPVIPAKLLDACQEEIYQVSLRSTTFQCHLFLCRSFFAQTFSVLFDQPYITELSKSTELAPERSAPKRTRYKMILPKRRDPVSLRLLVCAFIFILLSPNSVRR